MLSYNDGMEFQSALYLEYILSHGAYLRGFIQNENTNLMSTKFNKQRSWKSSPKYVLSVDLILKLSSKGKPTLPLKNNSVIVQKLGL